MEDFEDLSSDSSDEDYVPGKGSSDEVSELDEDDKIGSNEESEDGENEKVEVTKSKKRKSKRSDVKTRKRKGGIRLAKDDDDNNTTGKEDQGDSVSTETKGVLSEEKCKDDSEDKEKERANALWDSFLKDVEVKPKSKMVNTPADNSSSSKTNICIISPTSNKVMVTKVYDFAGEEVRVTEEVNTNSKAAKQLVNQHPSMHTSDKLESTISAASPATSAKQCEGLSGVLNKIGAKKKMSTLEKSRLDWMNFKLQEGIEDELKIYNRGKHGYLEKQAFIQRADERQFEVEKSLRFANRSNR